MPVSLRVDQLHVDSNFVASSLYRSFQDGGNTELLGNRLQILRLTLIFRRRGTRDDLEITHRRQFRENFVLYALGEVRVRLLLAEILERENRDRFLLGCSRLAVSRRSSISRVAPKDEQAEGQNRADDRNVNPRTAM